MFSTGKKVVFVGAAAALMVMGTASAVYASVSPGTTIKAALVASTDMTFAGQISGVPVTVSCTKFSDKVKTKAGETKSVDIPPAKISGCTDTLGGTDTIKTNATNGSWQLTVNKSGSTVDLVIPKAGATFTSSVLSGCVITAEPTKSGKVAGAYSSSAGTDTVTNATIPVKGNSVCSATTSSTSAKVQFSPNPGVIPPLVS
jgi:hypothetical protein